MPQVPQYEGQVNESAVPQEKIRADQPLEAFGGGQGMQTAISGAQDLILKARNDADKSAVIDADKKATQRELEILYGKKGPDGNFIEGAYAKKGEAAFSLPEDVKDQYTKDLDDINGELNPRQQDMFKQIAAERASGLDRKIMSHVANEKMTYDDNQYKSAKQTKIDYATLQAIPDDPNDPQAIPKRNAAVQTTIVQANSLVYQYGTSHGWSTEQMQNEMKLVESQIHHDVIGRLVDNGMGLDAKDYFAKNKDNMKASDVLSADKSLKVSSYKSIGFAESDKAFDAGLTPSQANKKFEDIKDPDARMFAEGRFQERWKTREDARLEGRRQLLLEANKYKNIGDIPPTLWAKYTPEEQASIAKSKEVINNQSYVQTDIPTKVSLLTMARSPDAEMQTKFTQIDFNSPEYNMKLSNTDKEKLGELQIGLKNRDPKVMTDMDGQRSLQKKISDSMPNAFKHDDAKKSNYLNAVENELRMWQQSNNKIAGPKEVQDIISEFATKAVINKHTFWFNEEKFASEMSEDEINRISTSDAIPKKVQAEMISDFKSSKDSSGKVRNRPPTEEELVTEWKKHLIKVRNL